MLRLVLDPTSAPFVSPPQILDEEGDPGAAVIQEYDGPLVLEFRAKLPGRRVDDAGYCRPSSPPPPADALRQQLWRQREQGQHCDVRVAAADGGQRPAHRCVLAAACPALAEAVAAGMQEGQVWAGTAGGVCLSRVAKQGMRPSACSRLPSCYSCDCPLLPPGLRRGGICTLDRPTGT